MVKKKHEEEKDIFEKELQSENEEEKEEERFEDLDDDDFDFDVDYDSVDHEANKPKKQEIKETILSKAEIASNDSFFDEQAEKLSFIEEDKKAFIGRKYSVFKKYGFEGGLFIGRVNEKEKEGYNVFLDSLNPHVVFVCGARGSGKSYVLGVIAEELAEKNKNVGIIVVDPIGVFWSMRFPNKDEKEVEKLKEFGLEPKGLENLKVFIPEGMKSQVPKSTFDAGFAMQPSLLTSEDWALTFGVDRFSVSGLLLDKVLKKVEKGYRKVDTNEKVEGKGKNYSLDDLIECLETDSELNSREKGYKQDSIRAIISRFEAAKSWGIFSENGTPLGELSRENQLTILDTSFLEDNVTALVIGILARRLLAARKISTRKEAANKFKSLSMNELLELEIPPTWLFIDEAHTLIPSGNEVTAATAGLIEYVKQGRRPGLSLVFATQQPSAINTKVLSQLDIIMTHKLIFDDDIKAVFKRTPTIIPRKYRAPNFIKTLPVGVALTGDRREETSRAFVMAIRPRMSQHEGRDAETIGITEQIDESKVESIAIEMISRNVKQEKFVPMEKINLALSTLENKYKAKLNFKEIMKKLAKSGFKVNEKGVILNEELIEEEKEEKEDKEEQIVESEAEVQKKEQEEIKKEIKEQKVESIELLTLPTRIGKEEALKIIDKVRKKSFLGIFGKSEKLVSLEKKHFSIWKVKVDIITKRREFISKNCFVNSMTGELLHYKNGSFLESKGFKLLSSLSEEEASVIRAMYNRSFSIKQLSEETNVEEGRLIRILKKLYSLGIIKKKNEGKEEFYTITNLDLPFSEKNELIESLSALPFLKEEAIKLEKEFFGKEETIKAIKNLWPNSIVKKIETIYKPFWVGKLEMENKVRQVIVDAVTGKIIS
ncbi:MAG: helicase HerA-like domain-containing protein [Candidatus Diapherotrites archaeon]